MYFRQANNQYILENTPFTIDNINYPANWLDQATKAQKDALGLVKVKVVGEFKDGKYYNNSEVLDGDTLTITSTAKPLLDVQKQAVSDLNNTAYSLLFPTDWMAVRAYETSTQVPQDALTYRANVRSVAASIKTAVNNATSVGDVATIMSNIDWPTNE